MAFTLSSITSTDVFLAFVAGLLPALLWLWFWLKEDSHPEPRQVLILTFLAGMMMAVVALFLEQFALFAVNKTFKSFSPAFVSIFLLFVWATIEEIAKYKAAKSVALRLPSFDEPIDAIVYMITAALGFASLENTLFIIKSLSGGEIFDGIDTSGIRFIGATLLHVATSAIVGASIAFSFFENFLYLVKRMGAWKNKRNLERKER